MSTSGQSPVAGVLDLTTAALREVQDGRAYVALPSAEFPNGYLRGQVVQPGEDLAAAELLPPPGATHGGSGGGQMLIKMATFQARYEWTWSNQVVGQSAHIHQPNGAVVASMTMYPDGGGARGVLSLFSLQACLSVPCYNDVNGADGGVLLRSP